MNMSLNLYTFYIHSSLKKDQRHYQLFLEDRLPDSKKNWHEHSWYNWPSNDHSVSHST